MIWFVLYCLFACISTAAIKTYQEHRIAQYCYRADLFEWIMAGFVWPLVAAYYWTHIGVEKLCERRDK